MEIIIGKDIREYKVKDIGPFTISEIGYLILAMGAIYCSYILQKYLFGTYISLLLYIPAIPFFLLGFAKPYGLPFKKWMKTVFVEMFINPKIMPYESDYEYNLADFMTDDEINEYLNEDKIRYNKVKLTDEQKLYMKGYK